MSQTYALLLGHGYTIIFFFALGERIGFPLLLTPFMIAAGALAGSGRMSLFWAVTLTAVAFLLGDLLWYELGRRRGAGALRLLCRLSLSPDSCVSRSKRVMEKHAEYSLLYCKFVPGVGRIVPPLAGTLRMNPWRFVVFSLAGSVLWALSVGLTGYIPAQQMSGTQLAQAVVLWLLGLGMAAIVGNIVWKYINRQRLLRELRMARVSPAELQQMLEQGEPLAIVDLRHALDYLHDPRTLPGALRIKPEEIAAHSLQIPKDRDVILYCT
ncbi:MAG TPA: VTT domain-containing protein [Terriglobales bacterium]|jgi:membrane protein DedA with SNARE-associated domain|nr:VTT domain-containing protein [Terriglobales bacterium]